MSAADRPASPGPDPAASAHTTAIHGVARAELTGEPLVAGVIEALVAGPGTGATVVFTGSVRDLDGGRPVVALSYSAHPAAAAQLADITADVAAAYPAVRLAVGHRTGDLVVGDTAFVVAAGAAHRAQAFEAARVLVDRVKAEVAIWKQQTFADGSTEWVGLPGGDADHGPAAG